MDKTYVFEQGNGGYGNVPCIPCSGGFGGGWGNNGLVDIAALGLLFGGGWGGNRWGNGNGIGGATFGAVETAQINDHIDNAMIESKVCDVQMQIADVKNNDTFNAKDIIRAMDQNTNSTNQAISECCCNTNLNITRMGYEDQIAVLNQTNQLTGVIAAGNSALGCKLDAINQNINDQFCRLELTRVKDQRNALAAETLALKGQLSQDRQTAAIIMAINAAGSTAS